MTLTNKKCIRELLIIKDLIKNPFVEINTNLEFVFEEYKHRVHVDEENVNLDDISIEILKTLRLYLKSIIDLDIYNIEYIKDVSKKLLTFKNLIDISEGYFYLLENVYLDMMELMEDLSYYKLGQDQYKQELTQILELFEQDLEEEKLNLEEVLQASY